MGLDHLKALYENLKKAETPFEFKEELLSSDETNYLELHYKAIQDKALSEKLRSTIKSFFFSEALNKRDKTVVGEFLYQKYKSLSVEEPLKADIIQLLGHLRNRYAREAALENITIRKGDLRYRSIIVLGWVGSQKDLGVLNDRLLNDPDGQLRGYAATAMRQIWFNHAKTKDEILGYLKIAIDKEEDDRALEGIIITAQELLKKKLGLKESKYGDVSGDYQSSKIKTQAALKAY